MLKMLNGAFVGKMRMADVGVGGSLRLLKQAEELAFRKKARWAKIGLVLIRRSPLMLIMLRSLTLRFY